MKTDTKIYKELIQANGKKCCVKGCYNMASDITLMTEANYGVFTNPNGEMYNGYHINLVDSYLFYIVNVILHDTR